MAAIIAFFTSAIGRYVIIGGLVVAALIGIRQSGVNSERRKCEAAAQQRAVEIRNKDLEIGRLQKERDDAISAEQSKQEDVDRVVQEKLEAELSKRPVNLQCRATSDDLERLR